MKFKHANLEKQVTQLPKIVQWCKKCTISNQRPRIIFDKNGVCSGCNFADYKNYKINWAKREEELLKLLDKHRSKNGSWDVIVPSSGGKDSGYVAHQLKYKYGMNPVTVTWAPLEYTDIGWQNLQNKIRNGFDNFLYTPNGIFHRKLARLCFEELGDAFHVFVLGQVNFPFHMAIKLNIPLVFFGENGELEYSGDPKHRDKPFKSPSEWVGHYFKGVTFDRLINFGIKNKKYMKDININKIDTKFYKSPSLEDFKKAKIKGKYFFSYFKKWTPQENFYYCSANTGFKPNPERSEGTYSKYASLDDKMDGFHYYLRYIKFGLGRCTEEVSHEIRDKHLSREDGKLLIKKYEGEFPKKYFQDFLNYLNISEKHFWEVCDSWRPKNLWVKKKNVWHLKHPLI